MFGFSKLDVMFGRAAAEQVRHPYADIVKPGVRFVQTAIRAIDPADRAVQTDAGVFEGDVLVVALGADLDPSATPGLIEGGTSSTRWSGGSQCARCSIASRAAVSSSACSRRRTNAHRRRARPRC